MCHVARGLPCLVQALVEAQTTPFKVANPPFLISEPQKNLGGGKKQGEKAVPGEGTSNARTLRQEWIVC